MDLDLASIAPVFSKSTFQAFRAQLTFHQKEGLAFESADLRTAVCPDLH